MAILKSINTTFGAPATYWHVCAIGWDITSDKVGLQLAGFFSAEARNTPGGIPLARVTIEIDSDDEPPSRTAAYEAIKLLPEWADAADC